MNKKDLSLALSHHMGWTQKESLQFIEFMFDWIKKTLIAKQQVILSGFGCFSLNFRKKRRLLHPVTGQEHVVPERYVPQFTPSRLLTRYL